MSLFKLYCQFNLKKTPVYEELINTKYICSLNSYYFGLAIDVNKVSQVTYEKKVRKKFLKYKVEDFFITNTKFEGIVENADKINVSIKNTKFDFTPDNYEEYEKNLFRQDISNMEILEYLREFTSQGAKLKSVTLLLSGHKKTIRLLDDGCIYLSDDSIANDKIFKTFLEYLLTGRLK